MKVRTQMMVEPCAPEVVHKIGTVWGIEDEILQMVHQYMWLIIYDEIEAVGLVAAFPIHPCKRCGLVIEYMRWNPQESTRRRLEAAVTFMRAIPASAGFGCIGYSDDNDFKFFKMLQKDGCIRKIGMQRTGFNGRRTAWETSGALLQ